MSNQRAAPLGWDRLVSIQCCTISAVHQCVTCDSGVSLSARSKKSQWKECVADRFNLSPCMHVYCSTRMFCVNICMSVFLLHLLHPMLHLMCCGSFHPPMCMHSTHTCLNSAQKEGWGVSKSQTKPITHLRHNTETTVIQLHNPRKCVVHPHRTHWSNQTGQIATDNLTMAVL